MPQRLVAGLAGLLACAAVLAESSPYYLGVSQSVSHDSNLFRLPDGTLLPDSVKSRSDTISSTALLAGVDQMLGRQRLYGSATLRSNRFRDNDRLDNEGHGLNLALDWATIARLSGTLALASSRSLRKFDPSEFGEGVLERNIESVEQADAVVRLGVVTRLTAEAALNHRRVDYSSARFSERAYRQDARSLGLRYRLGGATTLGSGLRWTDGQYPNTGDRYERRDVDLTTAWNSGGAIDLQARLSFGKTEFERFAERNFSGASGALKLQWQPTGKLKFTMRAARDTGQDSNFLTYGGDSVLGVADFSRSTNSLRLNADYEFSAKINIGAALGHARRSLVNTRDDVFGRVVSEGSDRTTSFNIGPRWAPTRSVLLGCELSREQRSASGAGSSPYHSDGLNCFGQFVLQ